MRDLTAMAIALNKGWIEDDLIELLSAEVRTKIADLSPADQWEAYLTWHGIIGYANQLHTAHKEIFK